LVHQFEATRDFIKSIFTPEEFQGWKGKSDFYTLFLALAPLTDQKITVAQKDAISNELSSFRKLVDQAKRKDNQKTFSKDVHDYAEAVTRAATDLGRRETRLEVLEKRIEAALRKVPGLQQNEGSKTPKAKARR
jgi:hypothetical protein